MIHGKYRLTTPEFPVFYILHEMENTGFLGVARRYFLRIIFSKFFTG